MFHAPTVLRALFWLLLAAIVALVVAGLAWSFQPVWAMDAWTLAPPMALAVAATVMRARRRLWTEAGYALGLAVIAPPLVMAVHVTDLRVLDWSVLVIPAVIAGAVLMVRRVVASP